MFKLVEKEHCKSVGEKVKERYNVSNAYKTYHLNRKCYMCSTRDLNRGISLTQDYISGRDGFHYLCKSCRDMMSS